MTKTTAYDAREQALAFHKATFGRISWPEGAVTVLRYGQGSTVDVVPVEDAEAFAETVALNESRDEVFATTTPRHAGSVKSGGYQVGKMEDIHDPRMVYIDSDVAKPGYPATIEEAKQAAEAFALPPHAITCSGRGIQLFFLLENPLQTVAERMLVRNLDSAYKDHLAARGFKMDDGVTTNLTRPFRVPGSWNRKPFYIKETGGPLQAYLLDTNPDIALYTAEDIAAACPEDRTFADRYADKTLPGTQMSMALPIGRILSEVHEWVLDGERWCSNVAGSSTERSASRYFTSADSIETTVIWSSTTAEEFGVEKKRPYSSFDWLTAVLCGGNRGLATRLAARSMEAESFEELLELFKGKEVGGERIPYSSSELADLARKASTAWPAELERQHSVALAFRGVAADIATGRGYRSLPNLASVIGIWGEDLSDTVIVQGSGMEIGVHSATREVTTTTVRADRTTTFKRAGAKGMEEMVHPERGMKPFKVDSWNSGLLDANPLCKELVGEREVPLILVSSQVPYSLGQIHADGILSAAHREDITAAVVSTEFFTSTMVMAGTGENSTRANRAGSAWTGIPVRDRIIYLGGRQSWRRANGLIDLGEMLQAKGAIVKVLDFPETEDSFRADSSEPSVADFVAGDGVARTLKAVMENALTLEEAKAESVSYDPTVQAEVAERVISELDRLDIYRFNQVRGQWIRNLDTHWVTCPEPTPVATKILKRDGFRLPAIGVIKAIIKDYAAKHEALGYNPQLTKGAAHELNVLNGVVDLRTGSLRAREHAEVFETVARANYDPTAKAPRWEKFLEEIFPDADTRRWLQEYFGAVAFGESKAEIFPFFVGSGGNGKSILVDSISSILSSLSTSLDPSVLESGLKEHQWASLADARMVVLAELPSGMKGNTGVLKALTSIDPKPAAYKYGQAFSYIPTFSALLMTNHLPYFREMDGGTWRRIRIVRFPVQSPWKSGTTG